MDPDELFCTHLYAALEYAALESDSYCYPELNCASSIGQISDSMLATICHHHASATASRYNSLHLEWLEIPGKAFTYILGLPGRSATHGMRQGASGRGQELRAMITCHEVCIGRPARTCIGSLSTRQSPLKYAEQPLMDLTARLAAAISAQTHVTSELLCQSMPLYCKSQEGKRTPNLSRLCWRMTSMCHWSPMC